MILRTKLIISILILLSNMSVAMFNVSAKHTLEQQELTALVNNDPRNPNHRFELAMNYAYTGWIELGWEQLSLIPKLEKNYEKVVFEKYSKKIKEDPNNWTYHFKIAFAHYFSDNKEAALNSFKKVIELNPKQVWTMGFIALIYGEKQNLDECIKWCKRALAIENNATAIHFLLGKAYYEGGNFFGFMGESMSVVKLKSVEAKYRPTPPIGIQ